MRICERFKINIPSDPRVQSAIAPFQDDMLTEHDIKDRKELANLCLKLKKYGGGLTCNQVGLF